MVKLEIPPLQNTTTDVVIVANRLIKRVMNVLHDAVSVQSAKNGSLGYELPTKKNLSTTMSQIRVLDILGKKKHRRAPRIKVHLHHNADDSFITTAQATPDTGAEATVAGLDILKQIGLDIGNTYHPPEDTIITANGTSFECVGTVDLHIHAADKSMKETVIICKEQKKRTSAGLVCMPRVGNRAE